MRRLLLAAAAAALLFPGQAAAGRYAVGVEPGASLDAVAAAIQRTTGTRAERKLAALRALVVDASSARALRALDGVEYVERLDTSRRVAFVPNDPIAAKQWHLEQVHAFDFWPELPAFAGRASRSSTPASTAYTRTLASRIAARGASSAGAP